MDARRENEPRCAPLQLSAGVSMSHTSRLASSTTFSKQSRSELIKRDPTTHHRRITAAPSAWATAPQLGFAVSQRNVMQPGVYPVLSPETPSARELNPAPVEPGSDPTVTRRAALLLRFAVLEFMSEPQEMRGACGAETRCGRQYLRGSGAWGSTPRSE
jgi:hypothetical protein